MGSSWPPSQRVAPLYCVQQWLSLREGNGFQRVFGEVVISTVQKRHVITSDYSHPIDFDSLRGICVTVGDDGKCLTGVCRRMVMALYVGLSMPMHVCL